MIDVSLAYSKANQIGACASELSKAKGKLSGYKQSIVSNWQGQEVGYIIKALDNAMGQIDTVMSEISSVSSDIKTAAEEIRQEEILEEQRRQEALRQEALRQEALRQKELEEAEKNSKKTRTVKVKRS